MMPINWVKAARMLAATYETILIWQMSWRRRSRNEWASVLRSTCQRGSIRVTGEVEF